MRATRHWRAIALTAAAPTSAMQCVDTAFTLTAFEDEGNLSSPRGRCLRWPRQVEAIGRGCERDCLNGTPRSERVIEPARRPPDGLFVKPSSQQRTNRRVLAS